MKRLVDEAVELLFRELFFTGAEPLLLNEIYDMLAYALARMKTHLLTNAMSVCGPRLDRRAAVNNDNLILQVSRMGPPLKSMMPFVAKGTWEKTLEGIRLLMACGFHVMASTTETEVNSPYLAAQSCSLHLTWAFPDEDHIVCPLAVAATPKTGVELSMEDMVPEVTVNLDGALFLAPAFYSMPTCRLPNKMFPLRAAVERIQEQLEVLAVLPSHPLCNSAEAEHLASVGSLAHTACS